MPESIKRRRIWFCVALLWILISPSSHHLHAIEHVIWPPIASDADRVKFLLWVNHQMPDLFPAMVDYGTDYMEVLENQDRLNRRLGKHPEFSELLKHRPDRIVIDVEVFPTQQESSVQEPLTPGLEEYGRFVQAIIEKLPHQGTLAQTLKHEIEFQSSIFQGLNLKKFQTLLVNSLPVDKKTVFPMPVAEKIKFLRQEFGATLGSKIDRKLIDPVYRGLYDEQKLGEGERALEVLDSLRRRDERLTELLNTVVATQSSLRCYDFVDAIKYLENLKRPDALALGSSTELQSRFRFFAEKSHLPLHVIADVGSQLKDYLDAPLKAFGSIAQSELEAAKPIAAYHLTEEPVQLAVVGGGCWGRDCNTKNLSAYNNSPMIKVFSIDREIGKQARGRVDVAIVTLDGNPYLFLNTINGPGIDAQMTKDIIHSFQIAAKKIGTHGLILSKAEDLEHNINFDPIREGFVDIVKGKPLVKFGYPDAELRKKLGPYAKQTMYHDPDKVFEGVLYQGDTMSPQERQYQLKFDLPLAFDPGHLDLDRAKVTTIALELDATGSTDLADRFATVAGLSPREWKKVRTLLRNEGQLTTDAYFAQAKHALSDVGVEFDPKFKSPKLEAYMNGLVRCPDAFESTWKDRSLRSMMELLKKGTDREAVAGALRAHPDLFFEFEPLKRWFEKAIEFDGPTMEGSAFRVAEVFGDAGYTLQKYPEIEKILRDDLDSDDYHRLAAAGTLYRLRLYKAEDLLPLLMKNILYTEGTDDLNEPTFIQQFQEIKRREPGVFSEFLIKKLQGSNPNQQRAALHALNFTEVREPIYPPLNSPELMAQLKRMRFEGTNLTADVRPFAAWLHEQLEWRLANAPAAPLPFDLPRPVQVLHQAGLRRVAVLTSEADGIFTTGGLGQAVSHYAHASNSQRDASRVTLIMPYYLDDTDLKPEQRALIKDTGRKITIGVDYNKDLPRHTVTYSVHSYQDGTTEILMLRHEPSHGEARFFENPRQGRRFYGNPKTLGHAFASFSKAAAQLALDDQYDIVSATDWHTGWANVLLADAERRGVKTPQRILWLHNALYKGEEYYTLEIYKYLGLDSSIYQKAKGAEYFGQVSPLKASAYSAQLTLTVSSQYAAELATPRFGYGLEFAMKDLLDHGRLSGILNGIDNNAWTPQDYSADHLSGKKAAKAIAQQKFGLDLRPDVPLIAMTSRVTQQKGFDYALDAIREFLGRNDAQVLIIGDPDAHYATALQQLKDDPAFKGRLAIESFSKASELLALRGADGFLLPSEVEPSGLNQLYSLRLGTVPIVSDVGGLKESVQEGRNGFVAHIVTERDGKKINNVLTRDAVVDAMERFAHIYRSEPDVFATLRRNGMQDNNSWNERVHEYEAAYDYVQSGSQARLDDGSLHGNLGGLRPSQLLMITRKLWKGSPDCVKHELDTILDARTQ